MAPEASEASKGQFSEFPFEIILNIAEFLPNGRHLFSLSRVCRAYHSLLERDLYVRFAPLHATAKTEPRDGFVAVLSARERKKLYAARRLAAERDCVLMWAVKNKQKETIRKCCEFVLHDSARLQCYVREAVLQAANDGAEEILETFLKHARKHVNVQDLMRAKPLRLGIVKLALKYGLDPNDETQPILAAMVAEDIEVPELLLSRGANPNTMNGEGASAAYFAAQHNDARFLQLLARYGANLRETCELSKSILQDTTDVEAYERRTHSPVFAASCIARNTNCLYFLIDNNYFNPAGGETCDVLLEQLCDLVDHLYSNIKRAKAEAAKLVRQRNDALTLLLNRGLDVNSACGTETLLSLAACNGNIEMINLLLQKGAIVDTLNFNRHTPLASMLVRQDYIWRPCHAMLASVKLLVDAGACINSFEDSSCTPLGMSIEYGNRDIFSYLIDTLKSGANFAKNETAQKRFKTSDEYMRAALDDGGQDGWTPLLLAAMHGKYLLLDRLLELGADPCGKGLGGQSPLHVAAALQRDSVCRLLLSYGADAFQVDDVGHDAVHQARNAQWFVRLVKVEQAKRRRASVLKHRGQHESNASI